MRLHRVTLVLVAIGIAAVCPLRASARLRSTAPPNIVVLLADDMGFGDPGCFNHGFKGADAPHGSACTGRTPVHRRPLGLLGLLAHPLRPPDGPLRMADPAKLGVLNPWDPALIEPGRLTLPAC